jgi:hypothetical protein
VLAVAAAADALEAADWADGDRPEVVADDDWAQTEPMRAARQVSLKVNMWAQFYGRAGGIDPIYVSLRAAKMEAL